MLIKTVLRKTYALTKASELLAKPQFNEWISAFI